MDHYLSPSHEQATNTTPVSMENATPPFFPESFPRRTMEHQGGSLPLKKRKLFPVENPHRQVLKETSLQFSSSSTTSSFYSKNSPPSFLSAATSDVASLGGDELMAALALAAVAVSPAPKPPQPPSPEIPSPTHSKQRIQHPRLSSPLQNGCHGLTSRNNSYCRRQPCYKGSHYCKLHYQQHVGDTSSPPTTQEPPVVPSLAHQDKRFVGASNEVRCHATTTRGRLCAYAAQGPKSKYCYLHADYDTNPPPRRGGATPRKVAGAAVDSNSSLSATPKSSSQARPPPTSTSCTTHEPLLLSMVSTDQWSGKRVVIATGPLAYRSGVVDRWGNGWVTVQIEGNDRTIHHNRRSFELHLEDPTDPTKTNQQATHQVCQPISSASTTCSAFHPAGGNSSAARIPRVSIDSSMSSSSTNSSLDETSIRQMISGLPQAEEGRKKFKDREEGQMIPSTTTNQHQGSPTQSPALNKSIYKTHTMVVSPPTPHHKTVPLPSISQDHHLAPFASLPLGAHQNVLSSKTVTTLPATSPQHGFRLEPKPA